MGISLTGGFASSERVADGRPYDPAEVELTRRTIAVAP